MLRAVSAPSRSAMANEMRQHEQGHAVQQRPEQLRVGVDEGGRGALAGNLARAERQRERERVEAPQKRAVRQQHRLGLTGRSRGVERDRDGVGGEVTKRRRRARAQLANGECARPDCGEPIPAMRDHRHQLGIARDGIAPPSGPVRIDRHQNRTAAHHRQARDDLLDRAVERHADMIARRHAAAHQPAGETRAPAVELGVIDAAVGVEQRQRLRRCCCALGERVAERGPAAWKRLQARASAIARAAACRSRTGAGTLWRSRTRPTAASARSA